MPNGVFRKEVILYFFFLAFTVTRKRNGRGGREREKRMRENYSNVRII